MEKTITVKLTESETMVIRDALIEHWQTNLKRLDPKSPIAIKMKEDCFRLREVFREYARTI